MNTFRKSLVKVVALAFLSILYSPVYADCNTLTSRTDLRPHKKSTVYIVLQQDDPNTTEVTGDFRCQASFDTPDGNSWSTTTKCNALANAISTQCSEAAGSTAGFSILNNSCNSLQTFTLIGNKAVSSVIMAISNTGFGVNDTGTVLPNYEREIVTPGCIEDATGGGPTAQPIQALLATKGTATGVSFVAGQPAAITVVVVTSNGSVTTAQVNTTAGMTAASIVSGLNTQLAQAGVTCGLVTSPFAAILCTQPSTGLAKGFGISTSDTGIGVGNASAPANIIMDAFNGPAPASNIVPLPLTALVVLASLLGGAGIVVSRRKRK